VQNKNHFTYLQVSIT